MRNFFLSTSLFVVVMSSPALASARTDGVQGMRKPLITVVDGVQGMRKPLITVAEGVQGMRKPLVA
jgi:hypothetical protein